MNSSACSDRGIFIEPEIWTENKIFLRFTSGIFLARRFIVSIETKKQERFWPFLPFFVYVKSLIYRRSFTYLLVPTCMPIACLSSVSVGVEPAATPSIVVSSVVKLPIDVES